LKHEEQRERRNSEKAVRSHSILIMRIFFMLCRFPVSGHSSFWWSFLKEGKALESEKSKKSKKKGKAIPVTGPGGP
jgi:hypothetical protein